MARGWRPAPVPAGDTMHQDVCEFARRHLVRNLQQHPLSIPQVVVERMMDDHADERAHDDQGLDFNDCAIALPFANVGAQDPVYARDELFPEHLRQLMFFQRGMQK